MPKKKRAPTSAEWRHPLVKAAKFAIRELDKWFDDDACEVDQPDAAREALREALGTSDLTVFREISSFRDEYEEMIETLPTRNDEASENEALVGALVSHDWTEDAARDMVQLAREYGWKTEFLDVKKLKARGAGAFLAVAQGSPEPDAGILHLRYAPKKKSNKPSLALVGKGICFDTGGTNLKPARHMHGMHEDMEGSAVALGTLLALTELKADFPVDCWLALAQNHIGPKAYKQNDVVKAANGKTIEIIHTDAEGRMVLADTLYFASQQKPKLIVDYATLTGACVGALSTRMSGTLTNREKLVPILIEAGNASGERVWPFPLPKDYEDALKSDIADIKQCTLDSDADHILAATFLKKFLVNDPDWVHVDLSAGNHKGGLAHIPTDITGFGVRFTMNLLMDQKILS